MNRYDDGNFTITFTTNYLGDEQVSVEEGKWWTKKNKFYEYHNESKKTDIYEYHVLDDDNIKFKSIKISLEMEVDSYEFTDTRTPESKTDNNNIYQSAIKVNNIREEYEYVRNNCVNCKVILQSLKFYGGKPFDILQVKREDVNIQDYIFDISSFFGKGFK